MSDWKEAVLTWPRIGARGWIRVAWRGLALGLVTYGCLILLLLVRLIERPLCGQNRPVTPYITQFVCRMAFPICASGCPPPARRCGKRGRWWQTIRPGWTSSH